MQIMFALPFLVSGCLVFLICVAIKRWRRYALGASLWCVALGPSLLVGLLFDALFTKLLHLESSGRSAQYAFLVGSGIIGILLASMTVIVHKRIIGLLPHRVFRLYSAAVSFGVGLLVASFFVILESAFSIHLPAAIAINLGTMLLVGALFATFVFQNSTNFRSDTPTELLSFGIEQESSQLPDKMEY